MTARPPVRGLDGLPSNVPADTAIYVKPLAGPWRAPARCEILLRSRDRVETVEADADAARAWAGSLGGRHAPRVAGLFERIARARPPFGGLDVGVCRLMGVVNVTPDSFSDGGLALAAEDARRRGLAMAEEGAAILDVGGESTRPGADPTPADEEIRRVIPAIERLAGRSAPISVDSRKAEVMAAALDAGASMVNDVSALTHDPDSMALVAERGAPVILMHALADPKTMQDDPVYDHVSLDVFDFLEARVDACLAAGIARRDIAVDPGIGFGKTLEHNLTLLRDLPLFHGLGCPVLLGASRKRFIGVLSGEAVAARRVGGSVAAALAGARAGARILRVHDVAETAQALAVWRAIEGAEGA